METPRQTLFGLRDMEVVKEKEVDGYVYCTYADAEGNQETHVKKMKAITLGN